MDEAVSEQGEGERPRQGPPREPVFNLSPVVLSLIVVCAGLHLMRVYLLGPEQGNAFIVRFGFIPVCYSQSCSGLNDYFVSPLTYSLLHGNFAHLAINMIWLAAFGSPLANRLGAGRFLLFWIGTVLGAVALHYGLHSMDTAPLIGASGAISGMMGAAARFAFRIDRRRARGAFAGPVLPVADVLRSRTAVVFLVVWLAVNLATGLGFGASEVGGTIAWEAHIGGFIAGFFGIVLVDRGPPAAPPPPEREDEPLLQA